MNLENFYFVEEKIQEAAMFSCDVAFKQYSEYWITTKEQILAPKTFSRYEELLNVINMGIGHITLSKLSSHHLVKYYQLLASYGANKKTGKTLAPKTILHHHRLISVILKQAVKDKIIIENIADKDHLTAPKVAANEARYLEENEIKMVIQLLQIEHIKWRTVVLLLLYTGMRRGELCGVEWNDIDFQKKVLHIKRTSQYISKKGTITKGPKNKSSYRSIKLSDEIISVLLEYKEWWDKLISFRELSKCIINYVDSSSNMYSLYERVNRLFIKEKSGEPIHPDSVTDWISKFCSKNKMMKFSPHSLRHTNVTLLMAANIPVRQVAARVGHAQTSTTYNIYSHALQSIDEKSAVALDNAIKNLA